MQNQYSSFTFFTVIVCQISVVEQEVQFPLKGREKKWEITSNVNTQ